MDRMDRIHRRGFLQMTGGAAAGLALGTPRFEPLVGGVVEAPLARIGLELYSVRKEMAKDFAQWPEAQRKRGLP